MMFLDTTKGLFNTTHRSEELISDFTPTLVDKSVYAQNYAVKQAHSDLKNSVNVI